MRTRMPVRPLLFLLLVLGIGAVRAVEGFPQDALSSLHRVVTHPGKYLEDAAYTVGDDLSIRQAFKGKRWWRNTASHNSLEEQFLTQGHADLPSRFSDSGGFLQLCLLLMFCLAVICCASMSINPWYKLDRVFVKRCLAGIWVGFALCLDMLLAKLAMSPNSKQEGSSKYEVRQPENVRLSGQSQQRGAKKAAKGKKRRGIVGVAPQGASTSVQQSRHVEETQSVASEESSNPDPETGEGPASIEPDSSPRVYMTPADAQIARLEEEAIEKQMQRLAKQKKHASQAQIAKGEDASQQGGGHDSQHASQKASQQLRPSAQGSAGSKAQASKEESHPKQTEPQGLAKSHPLNERKEGTSIHVKAGARRGRDNNYRPQEHLRNGESDQKDRHPRKPERAAGSGGQTLLVPRPTLHKQKPAEVQQIVEEHGEKYLAPQTPDRVAVQSTKSPLNSPQSMASPARPYAEVAKENLPRPAWSISLPIVPPPPPPPRKRISALPESSIHAPEFTPSTHKTPCAAQLEPQFGDGVPLQVGNIPVLSRGSAPPSLEIPTSIEYSDGPMTATSPFPGMSSHRKRAGLPVTGMYSNVLPNQLPPEFGGTLSNFTSRAPSSTESDPSPAFLGRPTSPWPSEPGFPGIFDTIWGNGRVSRSEVACNPWSGNLELVSDVSLASSSELGSTLFGPLDQPLLTMGHGSF